MKIRFLLAFVAMAISFAVPTFAQQKDTVDPQIIEQLVAIGKKHAEAVNNNDAADFGWRVWSLHIAVPSSIPIRPAPVPVITQVQPSGLTRELLTARWPKT